MIVCKNCGNHNQDSDEFCGSCGEFLEFVGEKVVVLDPPPEQPPTSPTPAQTAAPPDRSRGLVERVKDLVGLEDEEQKAVPRPSASGATPTLAAAPAAAVTALDAPGSPPTAVAADPAAHPQAELSERAAAEARAAERARRAAEKKAAAAERAQQEAEAAEQARREAEDRARAEAEEAERLVAEQKAAERARRRAEARLKRQREAAEAAQAAQAADATAAPWADVAAHEAEVVAGREAAKHAREEARAAERAREEAAKRAAEEAARAEQAAAAAEAAEEARLQAEQQAREQAEAAERARRAAALVARPTRPAAPPAAATPLVPPPSRPDDGAPRPPEPPPGAWMAAARPPAAAEPVAASPGAPSPAAASPQTSSPPARAVPPQPPAANVEAVAPAKPVERPAPRTAQQPPSRSFKPGDLICGNCGEGNDPSRNFCRRCGHSLAEAVVVDEPKTFVDRLFRREPRSYQAGARPMRRGAGGSMAATARQGRASSRRLIGTARRMIGGVVAVAALLGLVGVAVSPLRTTITDRAAGAVASVRKLFNPNIVEVRAKDATASTALPDHPATDAIDEQTETWWAEAADGNGEGEWLRIDFDGPVDIDYVLFVTGIEDPEQDLANPRPRRVRLVFSDDNGPVASQPIELANTAKEQQFPIRGAKGVTRLEIRVVDVHQGRGGSDMAISEVQFRRRE